MMGLWPCVGSIVGMQHQHHEHGNDAQKLKIGLAYFLRHVFDDTLELCRFRRTGEGDDVADVLHAGDEEDQAFKAKAEACMRARSPTAGVDVPPQMGLVHFTTVNLRHQFVIILLAHTAADDFTDLRDKHVL